MLFSGSDIDSLNLTINNSQVKEVTQLLYLGVMLDQGRYA